MLELQATGLEPALWGLWAKFKAAGSGSRRQTSLSVDLVFAYVLIYMQLSEALVCPSTAETQLTSVPCLGAAAILSQAEPAQGHGSRRQTLCPLRCL